MSARDAADAAPVRIDTGRQLFVDDALIAHTTLQRSFHQPRLHPASPVLVAQTPMELNGGVMPAATIASVLHDPHDGLFKMWYMAGYDDGFAYATSRDGLAWTRPDLDVVAGTNRILAPLPGYIRSGSTVCLDHEAPEDERFRMFAFYRIGTGTWPRREPVPRPEHPEIAFIYTSPDGVHWRERGRTGPCGDNTTFFRNPFRQTWAWSIRTFRGVQGRGRSYHEHPDFLESARWAPGEPWHWLETDARDRPDPQLLWRPELYKVDCVAYESLMLGLFGIYRGPPNHVAWQQDVPKVVDLHLGFSRDGLAWDRPDRGAFIASARRAGSWNNGYLQPSAGVCLVVGDELWFYFGAFSGVSPAQGKGSYAGGSMGLAVLRRDGFASMDGPGIPMPAITPQGHVQEDAQQAMTLPGTLFTQPLLFSGAQLFVNAKVQGQLRVQVLGADGAPVAGFETAECMPLKVDSCRHAVRWRGKSGVGDLAGTPVRLQFSIDAGELYSFWVSEQPSGASNGYLASGGPGFRGPRDT